MIVTANDGLAAKLLNELMLEIEEDRSAQPSVSTLISCLTKTYWDQSKPLPLTTQTKVFFLVGLGLERALLVKRKGVATAGVTDGIHWHVDSLDAGLVEVKSTRAGRKKMEEGDGLGTHSFPPQWLLQVKSYLYANGLTWVDLAVVFIIQADFAVYRLTFSQAELDAHWHYMRQRRDRWNRAREEGKAPESYQWNQDWECKDCQYKLLCETRKNAGGKW